MLAVAATLLWLGCTATLPEAPAARGTGRVSGKIMRVHPASSRLELADAGKRFSVFYSDETLIKSGQNELGPSDLREGDRVVVSLDDAGEGHARLLTVAGPPREAKPPPSTIPTEQKEQPSQ